MVKELNGCYVERYGLNIEGGKLHGEWIWVD